MDSDSESLMPRDDLLSKEELRAKFGAGNYVVFFLMLLVSAVIGVYYWWRGNKTTEDFLLAGRSMSTIPMTLSLAASFMSAITLLGVTMENYTYGTQFVVINISYLLSTPVAAHIFLPVFYGLQSASVYK